MKNKKELELDSVKRQAMNKVFTTSRAKSITLLNIPLTETQPQGKLERWYAQVTYRYRNLHELRKDAKHL